MNMTSVLQSFLRQQDYALLEYLGGGKFSLLAEPPQWFGEIWSPQAEDAKTFRLGADASPFLENFLVDAEAFWNAESPADLSSEGWIETTREGREIPLDAMALRVAGKRVLALQSRPAAFAEQSRILQTARDGLLVHERLLREIQKKEILLHCIIHDLSQPLTAMRGCFECLALEGGGSPRAKQLVEVGKQQSEQQEEMIREVLKAFSADLQDGMQSGGGARELPDILRCAAETVEAFTPVFRSKGLIIRLDPRLQGHAAWRVMGEATRLKRIFSNLVENALASRARRIHRNAGPRGRRAVRKGLCGGPRARPAEGFSGVTGLQTAFQRKRGRWKSRAGTIFLPHHGATLGRHDWLRGRGPAWLTLLVSLVGRQRFHGLGAQQRTRAASSFSAAGFRISWRCKRHAGICACCYGQSFCVCGGVCCNGGTTHSPG